MFLKKIEALAPSEVFMRPPPTTYIEGIGYCKSVSRRCHNPTASKP